jgi:nucleoside-diphosphate-sugar epimerase
MLRPIPYAHAMMTTSMRVSNAKAKRELGWAPAVSTYREGIPLAAKASR